MTDKIIEIAFSALTAAFAAYLFNLIQWINTERWRKFEEDKKIVLSSINNLRESSVRYWSKNYLDVSDKVQDESIIKQEMMVIQRLLRSFCSDYQNSMLPSENIFLNEFISRCYDLITGDEFESATRAIDITKCKRISSYTTKAYITVHALVVDMSPWWYKLHK